MRILRKRNMVGALILLVIVALVVVLVAAQPVVMAQGGESEPAHLVLIVDGGGDARINRMDWDVNAFAPIVPGTGVRASDYIDLSGRTTLQILCADLVLLDQRGSEVPRCDPYPAAPAFTYLDDPAWTPDGMRAVVTLPADLATVPPEVLNPGAYNLNELSGGQLDAVLAVTGTINGLGLAPEALAFALASYYREQTMYFEALAALTRLPDLGCTRGPNVTAPSGEECPLVQTPVLYLRIGELYEILGQRDDALRNYQCAATLSQALSDPANRGLAYARWANVVEDPVKAVEYYQNAINDYVTLGAVDNANLMLEICGSRNCTLPG